MVEPKQMNQPIPQLQKQYSSKVKINVDEILEKFDCPICMCKLTEPYISKCGHTFCKGCIFECVNRQHECPACRQKLVKEELFRNFSLELLMSKLQEEKEKESHKYFEHLAGNAIEINHVEAQNGRSPIETVFMLNLRESLLAYQEYLDQLNKEKDDLCKKIKTAFAMKVMGNAMDQKIKDELTLNIKDVEKKFEFATDALVQSYDEHMKKIVPKPKLLPIRISIIVECKNNMKLDNIHVKPYDNLNDLLKVLEEVYVKKGDPVMDWNKSNLKFILTGPLRNANLDQSIYNNERENQMMKNEGGGGQDEESQSLTQMVTITDYNVPFSKFNIAAGSLITIKGQIMLESDRPIECMTLKYDKDPNATFNYFSCKTCKSNWICESCRDGCHAGHDLLPHLMNHRPTWACCYCMKNNLCKIPNKKNPKGKK